jgi:hypothetical protein
MDKEGNVPITDIKRWRNNMDAIWGADIAWKSINIYCNTELFS